MSKRRREDAPTFFVRRVSTTAARRQELAEHYTERRRETFDKLSLAIVDYVGDDERCPDIGTSSDEGQAVYVGARIGTPSTEGQVYILRFRDFPADKAALKIMFADSPETEKSQQTEITYAEQASDLVEHGESNYFLLVYGWARCNKLEVQAPIDELPPGSPWPSDRYDPYAADSYDRAVTYAIKRKLLEQLNEPGGIEQSLKNYDTWSVYRLAALLENRQPGIPPVMVRLNHELRGKVLISELVWGDLLQYLREKHILDVRRAYLFVKDVFLGILDMQTLLRIVHLDLHVGNILVTEVPEPYGKRPMPLIHDFGKARDMNFGMAMGGFASDNLADAFKIIRSILAYSVGTMSAPIRDRLEALRDWIKAGTPETMNHVLSWWEDNADPDKEGFVDTGSAYDII